MGPPPLTTAPTVFYIDRADRSVELRKLKALLAALQAAGVTSYRDGDLTLTFGAAPVEVPKGDVEGFDESWRSTAPSSLAAAVKRIEDTYKPKGRPA